MRLSMACVLAAVGCSAGEMAFVEDDVRYYDDATVTATYADGTTRLTLTDLDGNMGVILEYNDGTDVGLITFAAYPNDTMRVALSEELDADWLYDSWTDGAPVWTHARIEVDDYIPCRKWSPDDWSSCLP